MVEATISPIYNNKGRDITQYKNAYDGVMYYCHAYSDENENITRALFLERELDCPIWRTQDGHIIPVPFMRASHLKKAFWHVVRMYAQEETMYDKNRRYQSYCLLREEILRRRRTIEFKPEQDVSDDVIAELDKLIVEIDLTAWSDRYDWDNDFDDGPLWAQWWYEGDEMW